MNVKHFHKGELILQEGSAGDEMYFVASGKVNVFKIINEEKVNLAILGKEDFFGEMNFFLEDHRTASVEALEETEVKGYSKDTFINLVKDEPDVALDVIKELAKRLKDAHSIIGRMVGEKKALEIIYKKK